MIQSRNVKRKILGYLPVILILLAAGYNQIAFHMGAPRPRLYLPMVGFFSIFPTKLLIPWEQWLFSLGLAVTCTVATKMWKEAHPIFFPYFLGMVVILLTFYMPT